MVPIRATGETVKISYPKVTKIVTTKVTVSRIAPKWSVSDLQKFKGVLNTFSPTYKTKE